MCFVSPTAQGGSFHHRYTDKMGDPVKSTEQSTSDPKVATVTVREPVATGLFHVHVDQLASADTPNGKVLVDGQTRQAPGDQVALIEGVTLNIVGVGEATVTVGPPAASASTPGNSNKGATSSGAGAGSDKTSLDGVKQILALQLWLGFGLILGGAILGMYFGTHNPSVNAEKNQAAFIAPVTTKVDKATAASIATTTTVATATTTTTGPASAGIFNPIDAGSTPVTVKPTTPGGTTSSSVSLVQALAIAVIAAGATLLPSGAASVLAGKIKSQD